MSCRLIVPAIASVNFQMCRCHNTARGCAIIDSDWMCYPGVVVFYFVIFLSQMMVTTILWVLISMLWGLFQGVKKSVGAIGHWKDVQAAMDIHHQQMMLYSPFSQTQGEDQQYGPLFANMRLLALQHWVHLWHRDLIGKDTLRAACNWRFVKPKSEEGRVLTLGHLNGHKGLFSFVYGSQHTGTERKRISHAVQSIFSLRATTYMVPVYSETVSYTWDALKKDDTLEHLITLYPEEWANFCERTFHGAPPAEVSKAFFAKGQALAKLFLAARAPRIAAVWQRLRTWPPAGKSALWTPKLADYPVDIGLCYFPHDPPPIIPPEYETTSTPPGQHAGLLHQVEFWAQQQVRWWATMRGQTLGRTLVGLMEMREALVDVVYLELKTVHNRSFLDVDYHAPSPRCRYDDVLAWLQRNRYHLFSRHANVESAVFFEAEDMTLLCPERALRKALSHNAALAVVLCAELACACFLEQYARCYRETAAGDSVSAYELLLAKDDRGEFELPYLVSAKMNPHPDALEQLLGPTAKPQLRRALERFREALHDLEQVNELRTKAEHIVADKFQVLVGAQVYEQQKATYTEINECLALWKLRHCQFMTAKDDARRPVSYWLRHADPHGGHAVHSYQFWSDKGGVYAFDNAGLGRFARKTELRRMWHRLKIGEGKAENQNNMINALFGEVVNILDMNQDAYYSEGLKLPLILPLFVKPERLLVQAPDLSPKTSDTGQASRLGVRNCRLQVVLGGDDAGILGFREHIFTYHHSVVGRYMALAEQAFGTLVQRFLSEPHHIRMHYGHPDMANAHLMKRTGGVSRGSLRVNVNEDIFLGYEMVQQGVDINFTEFLFYGKGRDVEFNAASVFLKKLAQGCVMQLASRQVCDLYLTHLTVAQKVALFYGTVNHFIIIWISDKSVFLFTAMWVLFQTAQITPVDLGHFGSMASIPWILPLGLLNALPMLVERKIEYTYLSWGDILFSIPFFSHQNRITSYTFSLALETQTGAYLASGRGLGNTRTSLVQIFVYHSITNFIPSCKLLMMVLFYCAMGGDVLFLLWPLLAAICYLIAPTLYNPKPTYKEMFDHHIELLKWLSAEDACFDAAAFYTIKNAAEPLDEATKEKIFGMRDGVGMLDERKAFVEDWEKAQKGGGMQNSLQSFWVFHWWGFMNNLDGTYNDPMLDSLFKALVWERLGKATGGQLDYAPMATEWVAKGYAVSYGPLASFLAEFCDMGMIALEPDEHDPAFIVRKPEGPDASVLQCGWHIRRATPGSEHLRLQGMAAIKALFWILVPLYAIGQRGLHHPYDCLHDVSWWALAVAAYTCIYFVLRWLAQRYANRHRSWIPSISLKFLGFLVFVLVFFIVFMDLSKAAQLFLFFFVVAVCISWVTEASIYAYHYRVRRSHPKLTTRSFHRLGFLMRLSSGMILRLYKLLFMLICIALLLLDLLLVVVQYLHTVWMFNHHVAKKTHSHMPCVHCP